jgi:hypothetical protein
MAPILADGKKGHHQGNVPARPEELNLNLLGVLNNKGDQGHAKLHRNSHGRPCRTDTGVADAATGGRSRHWLTYWLSASGARSWCIPNGGSLIFIHKSSLRTDPCALHPPARQRAARTTTPSSSSLGTSTARALIGRF